MRRAVVYLRVSTIDDQFGLVLLASDQGGGELRAIRPLAALDLGPRQGAAARDEDARDHHDQHQQSALAHDPAHNLALGRKSWLLAGSDRGGERAAVMYMLIQTARLNNVDPQAWLADVLTRINDHNIQKLDALLPWNWKTAVAKLAA